MTVEYCCDAESSLPFLSVSGDVTMVICPGIGNHSEHKYIRTFVNHSQRQGYRCAVLNHLGALPNLELTAPRLFTYGNSGNTTQSHTKVAASSDTITDIRQRRNIKATQ